MKKLFKLLAAAALMSTLLVGCQRKETIDSSTKEIPYFVDNVLETEKVKIEITDYEFIEAGAENNYYDDEDVIALWYTFENKDEQEMSAVQALMQHFTIYQVESTNSENILRVGGIPEEEHMRTQTDMIKKGDSIESSLSFVLMDDESPILIVAKDMTSFKEKDVLGQLVIELED